MTNNTTSSPHLSTKKVAIVILNWNGAKLMEEFLPSVIAYSPAEEAEVVVADNGSTDNSIALLQEKFPSVRIIRLDKNYGFAEGYNQALKQLDNEYTVLLNSDVEVPPAGSTHHWLPLKPMPPSPPPSPRYGHSATRNISNMPELPAVIWTFTGILIAGDACSMS